MQLWVPLPWPSLTSQLWLVICIPWYHHPNDDEFHQIGHCNWPWHFRIFCLGCACLLVWWLSYKRLLLFSCVQVFQVYHEKSIGSKHSSKVGFQNTTNIARRNQSHAKDAEKSLSRDRRTDPNYLSWEKVLTATKCCFPGSWFSTRQQMSSSLRKF